MTAKADKPPHRALTHPFAGGRRLSGSQRQTHRDESGPLWDVVCMAARWRRPLACWMVLRLWACDALESWVAGGC